MEESLMFLTEISTSVIAFAGGWWFLPGPFFWLLLIVGIVLLVRARDGRPALTGGGRETAVDVLDRRFAEGELSLEQYRERRSVLEEQR
jgi:putative membrane protein